MPRAIAGAGSRVAKPPFGLDEAEAAAGAWGMNCGPGALAGALGITPDQALALMPDFPRYRYTKETMMRSALIKSGRSFTEGRGAWPDFGLVRILWRGPWMEKPAPFYREYHSHWVAAEGRGGVPAMIFDINAIRIGGWVPYEEWSNHLVPWLLQKCYPIADTKAWDIGDTFSL